MPEASRSLRYEPITLKVRKNTSSMTAVAAIEAAQSTKGSDIQAALKTLKTDGVTGAISFDENGDAIKDTAYIKQAVDGAFQFVKVQTAK